MKIIFMSIFILLTFTLSANAALICTVQPFKGSKVGIATRPGKSGQFYSLVENKMTNEAIRCCVSYVIPTGTKIIITDQGFLSHTVRVLEGKLKGCVGDLPAENVGECK